MDTESQDHTELLQGIWREIKVVHQSLGRRIDENTARLDSMETTLERVVGQQTTLNRYVRAVVDRHDSAIKTLDERVTRLEADHLPRPVP